MSSPTIDGTANGRGLYLGFGWPMKLGIGTIIGFLGCFGLWSALAPLSGAAIAQGNLQVEGERQSVQHAYGGIVRKLAVKEGDRVAEGQVLLTLSEVEPRARLDILFAERDALLAEEARLVAERDRRGEPDFSALEARKDRPSVAQAISNETAILAAREQQNRTRTEVLRQRIAQLGEQRGGLEGQAAGLQRQRALLGEEAAGARQLLASGYTPKTRVLALERDAARLEAERGSRLAEVARVQEQVGEAELEIASLERTVVAEVTTRLREVQSQLVALGPKIAAAEDVLRRTSIVAPASGTVVGLNVFTEGGVIEAGAKLMDVVPTRNPLLVDARLRLDDVTEVQQGQQADVRLSGYTAMERPTIRGEVLMVSADRLTDPQSQQGYYAVKVRMNEDDLARAGVSLQAGMAAEVIIPTRPRTLFTYLVGPLIDEVSGSLRER